MSSFMKASRSKEDVKQGGNGNHITKSGCYPVTILAAVVSKSTEKGNKGVVVDMYVDHNGQKQIVYGNMRVKNKDGNPNEIGCKVFNQLMIIVGLDDVADPIEAELPIGKKGAMKTSEILEDLCYIPVIMRVQMEYGVWNGNITEKKIIRAFFRESDNATAEEIVNESEVGVQFEKEQAYVDNVTYKDDLTEEAVKAWIAASRPKGTAGNSSTAEAAPSFGKKRQFGA